MNSVQSTGHAGGGGMGKKDSQIEVSHIEHSDKYMRERVTFFSLVILRIYMYRNLNYRDD